MQDQLASRYYIVICIDSQCDKNGWIDSTLVPEFCKNFLEENSFSYLNLESLFPGLLITILSRPEAQSVLGS